MSEFKKEEKKGGFLSALSNLFGGGSSAAGGASGLGGAGSGFAGLFATKAGILGMVLGGATIAAGVGVVYNFIGPASTPVYNPQLFQETYYEEQANNAGLERARSKEESAASASSTLDLFREQAQKEGIGGSGEGGAADGNKSAASDEPVAAGGNSPAAAEGNSPASGAASDSAPNAPAGAAKLQASAGFGDFKSGGGSNSNSPRLSAGGGLSGGINGQFAPVYRPPVGKSQGASGAMKGSTATTMRKSSKYAVKTKGLGSLAQAKGANKTGANAVKSSMGGARTLTSENFDTGQTGGSGELGAGNGGEGLGVGLGGAGISNADGLKGSNPNVNDSKFTPPEVEPPQNVSPWTKYTDMALYGMIAATLLITIAGMLTKRAKAMAATGNVGAAAMFMYAKIAAYAAMAAAAVVTFAGIMLMKGDPNGDPPWAGQKWTGMLYMAGGAMLMYKAYQAMSGAHAEKLEVKTVEDAVLKDNPNGSLDKLFNMDKMKLETPYDNLNDKPKGKSKEKFTLGSEPKPEKGFTLGESKPPGFSL
ncbi:MAG: hypothetical protein A2270_01955 [Elusimicrobia bacterium RIFOXYA12_FULL_51_18]|nr:MAG: hypothetical protein A2270_01955 [Elusimicrobia bacterium RIFOXYA12_FULL_51_18]OGS32501.1 MAG: hypothetical protein A2218_03725 [Elusimicrobia bacterium RIFOXYA2_FULL_53_38]